MGQQAMNMSAPSFAQISTPPQWRAADILPKRDATRQRQFLVHIIQEALDLIEESGLCCDDDSQQSLTRP